MAPRSPAASLPTERSVASRFFVFNLGHLLTLIGMVVAAWWATLAVQATYSELHAKAEQNSTSLTQIVVDFKDYKKDQLQIDKKALELIGQSREDIAWLRGMIERQHGAIEVTPPPRPSISLNGG